MDMFIEMTFMHYGHEPGDFPEIILNEKVVQLWASRLHICSRLLKDMADLKDTSSVDATTHKEVTAWIKCDKTEGQVIRERLSQYIDLINAVDHHPALVKKVLGRICPDGVNVYDTVGVGKMHE